MSQSNPTTMNDVTETFHESLAKSVMDITLKKKNLRHRKIKGNKWVQYGNQ